MSKLTYFDADWVNESLNPNWAKWVQRVESDKTQALCTLCKMTFTLSNMGSGALKSHEKSKKHLKNVNSMNEQQPKVTDFFPKPAETGSNLTVNEESSEICQSSVSLIPNQPEESACASNSSANKGQSSAVSDFFIRNDATNAEILWALHVCYRHQSYNPCSEIRPLFQKMFPDSRIAEKMTIGSTKVAYNITHGLAPYFHNQVTDSISQCQYIVTCFDESLNGVIQKRQMDLFIHYWDVNKSQVSTRYFNSAFLGRATAIDLQQNFTRLLKDKLLPKIVQISMNGPNVNFKFLEQMIDQLDLQSDTSLLDMGSCGLHVVHGAFQNGHKLAKWNVNVGLRSFYKLFHDSTARRVDYQKINDSALFPLKFCSIRWVENVKVAQRALETYDKINVYVQHSKLPDNFTVNAVKDAMGDIFMPAKISFFQYVAAMVEPFLRLFQSDRPLAPFLYQELEKIMYCLMQKFIKRDVLEENKSVSKLIKLDLKSHKCSSKNVNIGIATTSLLNKVNATEGEKLQFRSDCRDFFIGVVSKLREHCPLKYKLTRAISSLTPQFMQFNPSLAKKRMAHLITLLHDAKWISINVSDPADLQFQELCALATRMSEFKEFDFYKQRLDDFYVTILCHKSEFKELFHIVKIVLILSHGNATVESGFSINSDILIENLLETSVVAQRQVYDGIYHSGGVFEVNITKSMMKRVRMSHSRYQDALKRKREERSEEEKRNAVKRSAKIKIRDLKAKKARLNDIVQHNIREIDAEMRSLIRKANDD